MGGLRQYVYLAQKLDARPRARRSPRSRRPTRSGPRRCRRTRSSTSARRSRTCSRSSPCRAQGYLALDLVRKNNLELIKGVDRATTTTVSALRTAVIVAQALADQKLVLDQITALNTTTVEPDRVDLGAAAAPVGRDQRAGGSATIDIEKLQKAFDNIYATHRRDRHATRWRRSTTCRRRSTRSRPGDHRVADVPRPRARAEGEAPSGGSRPRRRRLGLGELIGSDRGDARRCRSRLLVALACAALAAAAGPDSPRP